MAALLATFPLIALEGIYNLGALVAQPPAQKLGAAPNGEEGGGHGERLAVTSEESGMIAGEWTVDLATGWRSHRSLAAMWVLGSCAIAATVTNTGKVLALVGAVCSIPQMLILPPLMAIYAEGKMGFEGVSRGAPPALGGRYGQRALLVVGCILFVLCTYASLEHCINGSADDDDA